VAVKLAGLVAAPHTPMRADLTVDTGRIGAQAEFLGANGVSGAFVCGTTGEGVSLTLDERRAVVEAWRSAAPPGMPIIVNVSHTCLADARALAEHAQAAGADGFAATAPYYLRPPSPADLARFLADVARAAPELPFYYYHIPALTGVVFPLADILEATAPLAPNLAGVKFTHEALDDLRRCLAFDGGRLNILFGRDEMLLAGLALGARGGVGSTYNYAAPLYLNIMDAFARGDLDSARDDQLRSAELVVVLRRFGGLAAGKAMMGLAGMDCGPVRPPLRDLGDAKRREMRAALERIGFFEWCCRAP
jgi:N-acetylneuraminate lyase